MPLDLFSGTEGPFGGNGPTKQMLAMLRSEFRRYADALQDSLWDELEPLSLTLGGLSEQLLEALRANTLAVELKQMSLAADAAAWAETLEALSQAPSDELNTFREQLIQTASESLGSEDEAQQQIQRLLDGNTPLTRIHENYTSACSVAQANAIEHIVAAQGLRARAVYFAAFHFARSNENSGGATPSIEASDIASIAAIADDVAAFASSSLATLHEHLAESTTSPLDAVMRGVRDGALPRLRLCGALQGQAHRLSVSLAIRDEIGPLLLRVAEAAAMLRVVVSATSEVIARAASLEFDEWQESQRSEASELPLASAVPQGTQTSLTEVSSATQDELVEVQGIVHTLEIASDPEPGPKFSTFVTLRSFDDAHTVRLRAHMYSLEANGLRVGAACKVRGFVRREVAWLDNGETGIDIDRVSLTALRKQSWTDDLIYRMRPSATVFFDEMNMFYTPGAIIE